MKAFGAMLLLVLAGLLGFLWRGHREGKILAALQDTNSALLQKLGDATQARGHAVDYSTLETQTKAAMGSNFLRATEGQVLASLTTATAEVPAQASVILTMPAAPTVLLAQDRGSLPPLGSVQVGYTGTTVTSQWFNNREVFSLSHATYRTDKDGLRAAVRLQREVYSASGAKIGPTEELPVAGADATFSTDEVARIAPFPKYDLMLGSSYSPRGQRLVLGYGHHFTRAFTLSTLYTPADKGLTVIGVYSMGKQ